MIYGSSLNLLKDSWKSSSLDSSSRGKIVSECNSKSLQLTWPIIFHAMNLLRCRFVIRISQSDGVACFCVDNVALSCVWLRRKCVTVCRLTTFMLWRRIKPCYTNRTCIPYYVTIRPCRRSAISKCYLVRGNLARIFSTFTRNSEQRRYYRIK